MSIEFGDSSPSAITSGAALETGNLQAIAASLAIIDDWDETNRCKVDLVEGQTAISGGAGAVAGNTPRVTLASDDPLLAIIGSLSDAAWDGTGNPASLVAIWKYHADLLEQIVTNTTP